MRMTLSDYFEKAKGKGVIATADAKGKVGMAVYARPHFINEKTAAFIVADRLMHKNLQSNPSASYLFVEEAPVHGKRLYLTKSKRKRIETSSISFGVKGAARSTRATNKDNDLSFILR